MTTEPNMQPLPGEFKRLGVAAARRSLRLMRRGAGALAAAFLDFTGRKASTSRMRHQTLLLLRWLALAGQTLAILLVHFVLGHEVPLFWCALPILASAWLNVILAFRYPPNHRLSDREAALFMGYDILQLASLLYFTGGLLNPFAILFLAPVTIAAGTLSRHSVVLLVVVGIAAVTVLALFGWHWPLPWVEDGPLAIPRRYEVGMWAAMVIGLSFSAVFAWRVSAEATRMSDALAATEAVLAREQRLSAVGGLAAAAAHELGTPLTTISVVARELQREVKGGPLAEDVELLMSQAERCREILNRLTREAEASAEHRNAVPLRDLLDEIVEPHRVFGVDIQIELKDETREGEAAPSGRGPVVWRRPEILHGLANLVENAVDFARDEVRVEAHCTASQIRIRVIDDGPGFPRDVLDRLGEPFTSTRSRLGENTGESPEESHGMGLGFFIAKTLLERTGAKVAPANLPGRGDQAPPRGAVVSVVWNRLEIEASDEDLNAAGP